MKKYVKYIIAFVTVITALVLVCFVPIGASKLIPTVEQQFYKELGVKVHIDKLILRVGPTIKIKAPIMHVMYEDGQKFAQFDAVKFYIPWKSLFRDDININIIDAKNVIIKVNSNDKYLPDLLTRLENRPFSKMPDLHFDKYKVVYSNIPIGDNYSIEGSQTDITKLINFHNYKLKSAGHFSINDKKYISYDLSILPKLNLPKDHEIKDFSNFIYQVKDLDFYTDIIADLKLYNNENDLLQASGYVNIDNISVLDKYKKNPKSFIYLTLLGDKASILSNIYTSQDKKICLEGMINNSKKPVIDLKIKTDEIDLSDLYKKIKIFTDLSKFKNISSVEGVLNANFNLKGDLNKIKSNGYMRIANAKINSKGLNIEKINSDIDFSNNRININNTTGYVKNSPIYLKGYIDKDINIELLMNKVELQYLLPETIGVKSGIMSLVTNITGNLDNIIHKENLAIDNLKIQNDDYDLSVENFKIDTNKSNTAYVNNILCNTKYTELIKIPSLKLIVDKDSIKLPETNIFMPNSKLTAKFEVLNYNNNNITFNNVISGFIHSKDINILKPFSTRYPIKITFNGNKNIQNIVSQVLVEQTNILDEPAILNLVSKIEKNNIKIDDFSIVSFKGNFSDDFKNNLKGSKKASLSGIIENINKPAFKNIRITVPQMLNIHINDTLAQLKGDIFINGKPEKPDIIGQININNLFNQGTQLSISNTVIDFNKNLASLNAPLVKIGDSSMAVNANISTDFTNELSLKSVNIKSKYLNTDTLIMYKDSPLMKSKTININDGKFYSERLVADIYGSPVYLSQVNSDIKLENNIMKLNNFSAEIYNGKMSGNLAFNLKDETFMSKIMARGVSASPIFDIVSNRKDTISGVVDFDTNMTGALSSKQSLNGDLKFEVHNGRMSTLGKLEHLLYAQNVVADNMLRTSLSVVTKAITLKDTGLFKYLRGDVVLNNGVANIKMLQSQGPLMSLFIKGQYYPDTDYAKLTVLGRLSDDVVSGLGVFGDFSMNKLMVMLTGEEKKYNILPEDYEKIPQLPAKNTKEFRSIINGIIDKPSSVILFNWISYSQKSLRQKDLPTSGVEVPSFVDEIPY